MNNMQMQDYENDQNVLEKFGLKLFRLLRKLWINKKY